MNQFMQTRKIYLFPPLPPPPPSSEHVYFVLEEFSSLDSDAPVYAEIEDFSNRPAVPPPLESVVYTDVKINYWHTNYVC